MIIRVKLPDGTIRFQKYEDSIVAINEQMVKNQIEKALTTEEQLVQQALNLVKESNETQQQKKENSDKYEELKRQIEELKQLQQVAKGDND